MNCSHSLYIKSIEFSRWIFPLYARRINMRRSRTGLDHVQKPLQNLAGPFSYRLHLIVAKIADPSGETQHITSLYNEGPETNPLHSSGHPNMNTGQFVWAF